MTSGSDISAVGILKQIHEEHFTSGPPDEQRRLKLGLDWFRGLHNGQTCIVLGNGRSLEDVDLSILDNYFTFGTNFIYKVHVPTYYVLCDRFMVTRWWHQVGSRIHRGFVLQRVDEDTGLIPVTDEDIEYPDPGPDRNPSAAVMLKLAFHMGFSKAYLLGMDFDREWRHHRAMIEYDDMKIRREQNDEPFGPTDDARMRMRKHFLAARRNWKADGREIINVTPRSELHIFPSASWRTLIE